MCVSSFLANLLSHVHLFPQSIAEHECIHPTQEWVVGRWSISRDKCLISCDRSLEDMNSLTNHATLPKIGLQNTLQYVWQVSFHKIAIPWWETSTSIATYHVDRNVLSCTFLIIISMTHMKVLTHVHQRIFKGLVCKTFPRTPLSESTTREQLPIWATFHKKMIFAQRKELQGRIKALGNAFGEWAHLPIFTPTVDELLSEHGMVQHKVYLLLVVKGSWKSFRA